MKESASESQQLVTTICLGDSFKDVVLINWAVQVYLTSEFYLARSGKIRLKKTNDCKSPKAFFLIFFY